MKKILLITISIISLKPNFAQNYIISGTISDAYSGEYIGYTTIYTPDKKYVTQANKYGFYSLRLPAGKHDVIFSFVGYKPLTIHIKLYNDTVLNVYLENHTEIEEITVTAKDNIVNDSYISKHTVELKNIKTMPVVLGETDVVKAIQLLPGIQAGQEGSAGVFVRGGSNDQNLFLIDGVPVYNINHALGFFSVINEDAVQNLDVYKGGFPARYSGRLSSVIDIQTKEGNLRKYHGSISVGLISAKADLQGPIVKNKSSFFISARRTYIDLLARPFIKKYADGGIAGYYFYDVNSKINYKFSDKSRLFLTIYYGLDKYFYKLEDVGLINGLSTITKNESSIDWGNFLTSLRWNKIWTNKIFTNLTISYTRYLQSNRQYYSFEKIDTSSIVEYQYNSGLNDLSARFDIDYIANPRHSIKTGILYTKHLFIPGLNLKMGVRKDTSFNYQHDTTYGAINIYTDDLNIYIEDKWQINNKFTINAGLNFSFYYVDKKIYTLPEPRLSFRYKINKSISIKGGYANMSQKIHVLANSILSMPGDLWLPSTAAILPAKSTQYNVAFAFCRNKMELTAEIYYKTMSGMLEYKEGSSIFDKDYSWENKITTGDGYSYGIELLITKKAAKYNVTAAYTYSVSNRKFEEINFGKPFPFRYDRRHDINFLLGYKIKNIDITATWTFGTGYPFTSAEEIYMNYGHYINSSAIPKELDKGSIWIYTYNGRNNLRLPNYHHLDISVNFKKQKRYGKRIWALGVYNIYNRMNAYTITFSGGKAYKTTLFPILPFIRYSYKF